MRDALTARPGCARSLDRHAGSADAGDRVAAPHYVLIEERVGLRVTGLQADTRDDVRAGVVRSDVLSRIRLDAGDAAAARGVGISIGRRGLRIQQNEAHSPKYGDGDDDSDEYEDAA